MTLVIACISGPVLCAEPEGPGIATLFPGDVGIASHPAVVFVEDYEEASIGEMLARWEDVSSSQSMSFSTDVPAGSGGAQSVYFAGSAGTYRRVLPGHEKLYFRYYVKYATDTVEEHHSVWMGGHNPSTAWPWPRAGQRPDGIGWWSTGVEPSGSLWLWDFYTYWQEMRGNPGDSSFWGNSFPLASPRPANRGEWICVELMVKMNDPVSSHNGEQAYWIDGQLVNHLGLGFPNGSWIWDSFHVSPSGSPFEGFQWRLDPALDINYVWINHYVDSDPDAGAWYDHVVVATEYIGPMASGGALSIEDAQVDETDSGQTTATFDVTLGSIPQAE